MGKLLLLFVILLVVTFSRRPQDLVHAQFFAEDGVRFFELAYNTSWLHSLAVPYASYLHLVPRLAAGLAELVPLAFAPLVMNLAGAACQVAPAVLLVSERCATWGPLRLRMLLSVIYVGISNANEIHVNLTNSQWHLALLMVLLAFGTPPKSRLQKGAELLLFLLAGLTGPFCLALLPVLLVASAVRRNGWQPVLLAVLALTAGLQILSIRNAEQHPSTEAGSAGLSVRAEAATKPLGATPVRFVQITGGGMILNGIVGYANALKYPFVLPALALVFGVGFIILALWCAPLPFRLFAAVAIMITAAGLHDPIAFHPPDRWTALAMTGGIRYDFFGTLLFLWSVAYCVFYCPQRLLRRAGLVTLLLSCFGIVRKWEYPPWPDRHFAAEAERFSQAPAGQPVTIPIVPEGWQVVLIKH